MQQIKYFPLPHYCLAASAILLALLFTLLIPPHREGILLLFIVAIALTAEHTGFWPGLLATFIAAVIIVFLFLPPAHLLWVDLKGLPGLGLFLLTGLLITGIGEACKQAIANNLLSEDKYRLLIEQASDAILITDPSGNFVEVNSKACEMFGHTKEEFIQLNGMDLMMLTDRSTGRLCFNEVAEEKILLDERQVCRKEGTAFTVGFSSKVLSDGRVQSILRDVTERKLAEDKLRESEERYRDLFENANDIIYAHDLAGNFLSMNNVARQLFGYTLEEALKANIAQALPPDQLELARQMTEQQLRGKEAVAYELTVIAKGGHKVAIEVNTRLIYEGGKPVEIQSIARDTTERKGLEEQVLQSQKMEAIGRLAGGVAHDFNNLLTVINAYIDFLLIGLDDGNPLRSDAEEIKKAAQRATSLTRQLLGFSRKRSVQSEILDLNVLVSGLKGMLQCLIGEGINWDLALDSKSAYLEADPSQIEQVIINLVINARDAMPKGGNLTIKTSVMEVKRSGMHDLKSGSYVVLEISDTGCGIDQDIQSRIFEPFFTTKESGKGTGLGLSMVYWIVRHSNGHIKVESRLGGGTTFKVYLSQVDKVATAKMADKIPNLPKGSETILLVEDEDLTRKAAHKLLQLSGYKVLEASHPNEALTISREHPGLIHLMITDVVMPSMNGLQLVEQISSSHPEMKVLYMSGYPNEIVAQYGVPDSTGAFLQKPFTPTSLAVKIRELLA